MLQCALMLRKTLWVLYKISLKKIHNDDLILVYFYGHSCQVNGKNYLMPVRKDQIAAGTDIDDDRQ